MTAAAIVNRMLESDDTFGFGQQEKPEHWEEVPYGFVASFGTDRLEAKWDDRYKGYRFSKHWVDDYSGKPRVALNIAFHPIYGNQTPEAFIAAHKQKFESGGWTFKEL